MMVDDRTNFLKESAMFEVLLSESRREDLCNKESRYSTRERKNASVLEEANIQYVPSPRCRRKTSPDWLRLMAVT
jgi:hypothetical protein